MGLLREAVGDAPFVFVVGKGGVGKTTAAGALALDMADGGGPVLLISTDPAHSLSDLFGAARTECPPGLHIEEFDAAAHADAWIARATEPLTALVERGTYLDGEDVAGFTRLALPGVDELMAVQRLVELAVAGGPRVVVDTAPTGHTLRLLDAAETYEAFARALRAMADKAAAVAQGMLHAPVRLEAERIVDEFDDIARRFRHDVLGPSAFVVVTRAGDVVVAETRRLATSLAARGLRVAATVVAGSPGLVEPATCLAVPLFPQPPAGCGPLRDWTGALRHCDAVTAPQPAGPPRAAPLRGEPALPWLRSRPIRVWLVAGKGGTGKTTCAAALAVSLAADRAVVLCSADPAGSLDDVLGGDAAAAGVRTLQVDARGAIAELRVRYQAAVDEALERMGLSTAAALDRRVMQSLWDLAPPGIDEIAALGTMLDAAADDDTIVLDSAPTGHFLRLLDMPALALDWTRQLMRVVVKYGAAHTGDLAADLLRLARELRALRALLRDPDRTGAIVVDLPEPMVRAETRRLVEQLLAATIPIAAVVINRAVADASTAPAAAPVIAAPVATAPLTGVDALREFAGTWNIVP